MLTHTTSATTSRTSAMELDSPRSERLSIALDRTRVHRGERRRSGRPCTHAQTYLRCGVSWVSCHGSRTKAR
jgi:hypothetical protein